MRAAGGAVRLLLHAAGAIAIAAAAARAQTTGGATAPIDLPTALRLAGAQSLDVQIAHEALREAEAERVSAVERFFPWLGAGAAYHRRDGLAQSVPAGTIDTAHFQSYAPGGGATAQVALGDALYDTLAARQRVRASDRALAAQRQDAALAAAQGYLELAKARALVEVARQAQRTSEEYQRQLHEAVSVGIAFRGDELRVQTQTELYEIGVRRALEAQRIAAAELARILDLDPAVELVPQDPGVPPLALFEIRVPPDALVKRAFDARPELAESRALVSAAREGRNRAVFGPLIPSVDAQAVAGALGGGPDGGPSRFGGSADYQVGVGWRIGPGGLFDLGRIQASSARLSAASLREAKLRDGIAAEVVSRLARAQSLSDQIGLAKRNLETASETLRLTRARKQYGVGLVLEDIQAEQALNQARDDYFTAVAEFDKEQYRLIRAVGGPLEPPGP